MANELMLKFVNTAQAFPEKLRRNCVPKISLKSPTVTRPAQPPNNPRAVRNAACPIARSIVRWAITFPIGCG